MRGSEETVPSVMPTFLIVALGLEFAIAATFIATLRWGTRARTVGLVLASATLLSVPLLVPPAARLERLLSAIAAALLALKLIDVHIGAIQGVRPTFGMYIRFLLNPFCFVQRRMEPARPRPFVWQRLGFSAVALTIVYALISSASAIAWPAVPFVFDHVVKATLFFLGVVTMFTLGATLVEALGGAAPAPVTRLWLARTPADFWRRYNRCLRLFFQENVFRYAGHWRSPARATLTVFVISGLLHEYAFSLAAGRLQGYQTGFFLLQMIAVVATLRLRVSGASAVFSAIATVGFLLTSSILFFLSLHGVVPFYTYLAPR